MPDIGKDVEHAARLLAQGGVVAFPTETVYGLGASVRQPSAVERVFEIKSRPRDRALIVHVGGPPALDAWARTAPEWAKTLAEHAWPGPLTLVLERNDAVVDAVTGGGATVGLRAPAHPLGLELIGALGRLEGGPGGIAAPSANPHGAIPPTTAHAVAEGLGDRVDYVLDGGPCTVGIESTVVLATGPRPEILREGAFPRERIVELTGTEVEGGSASVDATALPPQLHVVPFTQPSELELRPGDAVIGFGAAPPGELPPGCVWRGPFAELAEYGRLLYGLMSELAEHPRVYVQRVDDEGIGRAINARIDRAARLR